jgi:hypothetical protein
MNQPDQHRWNVVARRVDGSEMKFHFVSPFSDEFAVRCHFESHFPCLTVASVKATDVAPRMIRRGHNE